MQPLTTTAQQNWAAKLLGFDFEVVYKEGGLNRAADALSRRDEEVELAAVSVPSWVDWERLQAETRADPELAVIITTLEWGGTVPKHYSLSFSIRVVWCFHGRRSGCSGFWLSSMLPR